MPIESDLLTGAPCDITICPKCKHIFNPFLRGMVHRAKRKYLIGSRRPDYCALICSHCKEFVGYEAPPLYKIDRVGLLCGFCGDITTDEFHMKVKFCETCKIFLDRAKEEGRFL